MPSRWRTHEGGLEGRWRKDESTGLSVRSCSDDCGTPLPRFDLTPGDLSGQAGELAANHVEGVYPRAHPFFPLEVQVAWHLK